MAISKIASNPANPKTINLLDGYYSLNSNGETFPLGAKPYTSFSGQSRNGAILDADSSNSVIVCHNDLSVGINNLTITGAGGYESSSGVYCRNSSLNVENVTIQETLTSKCSRTYCV